MLRAHGKLGGCDPAELWLCLRAKPGAAQPCPAPRSEHNPSPVDTGMALWGWAVTLRDVGSTLSCSSSSTSTVEPGAVTGASTALQWVRSSAGASGQQSFAGLSAASVSVYPKSVVSAQLRRSQLAISPHSICPAPQPCTPSRSCMMPHAGSYHTLFLSLCTGVGAGGWWAAVLAQGHNRRWWEGGHSRRPLCTDGLWQHGVVALRPITSPPPGSRTRLLVSSFLSLLSRSTLGRHEVGQSAPGMGQWFWEHRAGPERGVLCRAVLLPLLLTASMGAISLARSTHRNASYCLQ